MQGFELELLEIRRQIANERASHPSTRPRQLFCDPHRARFGAFVPAQYVVNGERFCEACFAGDDAKRAPKSNHEREKLSGSLTREQILALLARAKAVRERDWLLLLVSFWHGLRATEAVSLTAEHFVDGCLVLRRLGGYPLRTVQALVSDTNELLNEKAAMESWLERHSNAAGGAGRLFPISRVQLYRLVRRYGRLAGLPPHLCHPHALRRSIAVELLSTGGIENVRTYLGHRSIVSTMCLLGKRSAGAPRARR